MASVVEQNVLESHYLIQAVLYGPWPVTTLDSAGETHTAWRCRYLSDGSPSLETSAPSEATSIKSSRLRFENDSIGK